MTRTPRLCAQCRVELPKTRSQLRICVQCREKKALSPRTDGMTAVHFCLSGGPSTTHPFNVLFCRCKQKVKPEEATRLIEEGGFVDLVSRQEVFTDGPIVCVSKFLRSPRCPTVERPHVERAFLTTSKYETAYPTGEEIERLRSIVAQDRAAREDEERLRIEIYFELNRAFLKKITIEVESDAFDKAEAESWGRPMTFGAQDERTSHGADTAFDLDFMDHDEDDQDTGENLESEENQNDEEHEENADGNLDDCDAYVDGCDHDERITEAEELAA